MRLKEVFTLPPILYDDGLLVAFTTSVAGVDGMLDEDNPVEDGATPVVIIVVVTVVGNAAVLGTPEAVIGGELTGVVVLDISIVVCSLNCCDKL